MITASLLVVSLALAQAESIDALVALDKALAAGRYAEAERGYLAQVGFPALRTPFLLDEMALAVNAAAQQGRCSALRKGLALDNPQHRYLLAMLDAAGGDTASARAIMTPLVTSSFDAGNPGAAVCPGADFLAFLDLLAGDRPSSKRHLAIADAHRERTLQPLHFAFAITTGLAAEESREKGKTVEALERWTQAVKGFERAAAPRHAFVAFAEDQRAALLDALGKKAEATSARARAATIRASAWCR